MQEKSKGLLACSARRLIYFLVPPGNRTTIDSLGVSRFYPLNYRQNKDPRLVVDLCHIIL